MKMVMSRKELCEALNISRTHLARKIKEKQVKPVESTLHTQKKLYMVSEIENAFGIKIYDGDNEAGVKNKGNVSGKDFVAEIGDILKQE